MNNIRPQIHLIIGTKAQLIKMYPIILELERHDIPFTYIDTGQHKTITKKIREIFGIRPPDYNFVESGDDITGIWQAFTWNLKVLFRSIFSPRSIFRDLDGICLVHGDTVSTLQGLIMGKRAGLKVAHIEAGERTHKLFKPFPEEITRVIVDRYADFAYASSDISYKNLTQEKISGEIINVNFNTIVDAVKIAREQKSINIEVPETYVLVSIHRFETINSRERLTVLVEALERITTKFDIVWGLHKPTKKQLERYNLISRLERNPRITLKGLWDYFDFILAMSRAEFLVTDGGGPQEESWILNIPCMLMRTETEREFHENVCQTGFSIAKIEDFIDNYTTFNNKVTPKIESPSASIVDHLYKQL